MAVGRQLASLLAGAVGSTDSAAAAASAGQSMRLCTCTGHGVRHSCVGCILLGRMVPSVTVGAANRTCPVQLLLLLLVGIAVADSVLQPQHAARLP
jgi:hypothetical protein